MSHTVVRELGNRIVVSAKCINAHEINQLIETLLRTRDEVFVAPLKEQNKP